MSSMASGVTIIGADTNKTIYATDNHQLRTYGVGLKPIADYAMRGEAFSWGNTGHTADVDDCVVFLQNDEPKRLLVIDQIAALAATTATLVYVHNIAYAASTGTAITTVALNTCFSGVPLYTAYERETSIAVAATDTNIIAVGHLVVGGSWVWEAHGALVLGYHGIVGVHYGAVSATARVNILGHYENAY
jgi:hypothetical protein